MNNALKALVAVACIAVIVVAALWWSDRSAAKTEAEQQKSASSQAKEDQYKRDCLQMVDDWDNERRSEVTNRLGGDAAKVVEDCRWFWGLPKP